MDTADRGAVALAAEQFFKRGQSIQMHFLEGGICCCCQFELNFIDRAAEGPQQVPSHGETHPSHGCNAQEVQAVLY